MGKNVNHFKDWDADTVAAHNAKITGKPRPKPEPPIKKKRASKRSKLEDSLSSQLVRIGVIEWREEYKFHSTRDWRFDFAWPDLKIAAEVEGLIHNATQGGHQTMKGYTENCIKYNEAALWGWQVYRFTNPMIKSGEAAEVIQRALMRRAST